MAKLFEDSIGNLEYLLLGLTFLGVMYLVMKQAKYTISLQRSGLGNLGPGMAAWAAQPSQGYPTVSGFSNGSNEPPVWNATPFDPSEYDQAGSVGNGSTDFQSDIASAGGAVQFSSWSNNTDIKEVSRVTAGNLTTVTYSNGYRVLYDKNDTVIAQYDNMGRPVMANTGMLPRSGFNASRVGYAKKDGMTDSLDRALVGHGTKLA